MTIKDASEIIGCKQEDSVEVIERKYEEKKARLIVRINAKEAAIRDAETKWLPKENEAKYNREVSENLKRIVEEKKSLESLKNEIEDLDRAYKVLTSVVVSNVLSKPKRNDDEIATQKAANQAATDTTKIKSSRIRLVKIFFLMLTPLIMCVLLLGYFWNSGNEEQETEVIEYVEEEANSIQNRGLLIPDTIVIDNDISSSIDSVICMNFRQHDQNIRNYLDSLLDEQFKIFELSIAVLSNKSKDSTIRRIAFENATDLFIDPFRTIHIKTGTQSNSFKVYDTVDNYLAELYHHKRYDLIKIHFSDIHIIKDWVYDEVQGKYKAKASFIQNYEGLVVTPVNKDIVVYEETIIYSEENEKEIDVFLTSYDCKSNGTYITNGCCLVLLGDITTIK